MFLRHSVIQSAVLILCFRFCFNILIRRKQSVIQIKGIKRTMTAGFLVVDVVRKVMPVVLALVFLQSLTVRCSSC